MSTGRGMSGQAYISTVCRWCRHPIRQRFWPDQNPNDNLLIPLQEIPVNMFQDTE